MAAGLSVLLTAWIVPPLMHWSYSGSDLAQLRTVCSIVLFIVGIAVLARVARPLRSWRGILVLFFFAAGVIGAFIPFIARFFEIYLPAGRSLVITAVAVCAAVVLFFACYGVQGIISRYADRSGRHPVHSW